MSKDLQKVVDGYSDLLIKALETSCSDKLLIEVLKGINQIHKDIDRGFLK
jgi:hypothetical protein